jgi:hypothetical protein
MRADASRRDDAGMFGKRKKILQNGVQAQAVVLASDMGGLSNSHGANRWKLQLRVQFDDGSTAEVTCHAYAYIGFAVGSIVPVRYDPSDRSTVEVDTQKLKAENQEALEASRAKLIEAAESKLAERKV